MQAYNLGGAGKHDGWMDGRTKYRNIMTLTENFLGGIIACLSIHAKNTYLESAQGSKSNTCVHHL